MPSRQRRSASTSTNEIVTGKDKNEEGHEENTTPLLSKEKTTYGRLRVLTAPTPTSVHELSKISKTIFLLISTKAQ